MNALFILPVIIALAVFAIFHLNKSNVVDGKRRQLILMIGLSCAVLSIVAVLISVYISRDFSKLYSIALPIMIIIIGFGIKKQTK